MSPTLKVKLVFALSISLGVLILHGFSFFAIAVFLYAAGTALIKGSRAAIHAAIVLGGLSLLFAGSSQGAVLLTIGAIFAVVLSDSVVSRCLFSLSAAAILFSGDISGMIPLTIALLTSSLLKRGKWRVIALAGGISIAVIISGFPSVEEHRSVVLQEVLDEDAVIWPIPAELNLALTELILQAPGTDAVCLSLDLSAGGVRDNDPVGYVASDDRTFPIYPGENTLIIEEPVFPVSIRISRTWKPFSHPVIHFHSAEASF